MLGLAGSAKASNTFAPAGTLGEGTIPPHIARIAVDDSTGNVLLADDSYNRVDVFDSSGPGAPLIAAFGEGELSSPYGIAVDQSSGDVYVTDPGNNRIVRYTSDGATPPLYTADATFTSPALSPTPGAGAPAGTIGDFKSAIAVDPSNGDLLVADRGNGRISRFTSSGSFVSAFDGSGSTDGAFTHLEDLAITPGGQIFVSDATAEVAGGGSSRVLRFSAAGGYQATVRALQAEGDAYLAYDATHTQLIVGDGRSHIFENTRFLILDPSSGSLLHTIVVGGEQLTGIGLVPGGKRLYAPLTDPCEGGCGPLYVQVFGAVPEITVDSPSAVTATGAHLSGTVNPNGYEAEYQFEYSADGGSTWAHTAPASAGNGEAPVPVEADLAGLEPNLAYQVRLAAWSVGPRATSQSIHTTTLEAPPGVATDEPAEISDSTALLRGRINPHGLQSSYYFEYGLSTEYGSRVPVANNLVAGEGHKSVLVARELSDVQPGTKYHYRLVGVSSAGVGYGGDQDFTAEPEPPKARAYEMVSPAQKGSASPTTLLRYPAHATPDGSAIVYTTRATIPTAASAPLVPRVVARRSETGWTNTPVDPPLSNDIDLTAADQFYFSTLKMSTDLRRALVYTNAALTPDAKPGEWNLFSRDIETGTNKLLLAGGLPELSAIYHLRGFLGASDDLNALALNANGAVEQWTSDAGREIASISPGGTQFAGPGDTLSDMPGDEYRVSADGRRVFLSMEEGLYVREDGTKTRPISVSQRPGDSQAPVRARFLAASPTGRYVIFVADTLLTQDASGVGPYAYQYDLESGALTYLAHEVNSSAMHVVNPENGSLYFEVANAENAIPGMYKREIRYAKEGVEKAVVGPVIEREAIQKAGEYAASPNDRFLAFVSDNQLTDFVNNRHTEVYLYDSATEALTCPSCRTDGGLSLPGNVHIGRTFPDEVENYAPTMVLNDGAVFFDTTEPLVAKDSNGTRDVYMVKGGNPTLITTGKGDSEATFMEATPSGSDVFFVTDEQLVGSDSDNQFDMYDARVGGGISAQNKVTSGECSRLGCRASGGDAGQAVAGQGVVITTEGAPAEVTGAKPSRKKCRSRKGHPARRGSRCLPSRSHRHAKATGRGRR